MSAADPAPNRNSLSPVNRLIHEKSPYLLQHASNPVDWYPWGTEALEAARAADKPIFLSVGYSACHWCHVMEHESFENPTIAALLNSHFVSIKVDREERPDIDEIYMTAVQMMTGHGGWPMSVFLTPDGRPFYAGTYFPPASRQGRIGFPDLVQQLANAYENRREEVEKIADNVADDLRQATRQRPLSGPSGPLDAVALMQAAVQEQAGRFDEQHGGFGGAPKFPPHHALRLLTQAARDNDSEAARMLTVTLDGMALGGIYDHIGGGFHRYATDAVWLLPHFEKMLYDNALLARIYAEAYLLTGRVAYARIARETCDWVLRDMTDEAGGFHSALDADSEGEEGKYYVWKRDEVNALLDDAAEAFAQTYHILPGGNYREEATGHVTGTNIPYLSISGDVALPDELTPATAAARETLLDKRYDRVPPGKDDKVISSWNGLMIGALAIAGEHLKEPRYTDAARRAAEFCLTTLRPGGALLRRYARGEVAHLAFLDDHAYLADGLLDLYDVTGEERWAEEARSLTDALLAKFWDPEDGGFFFAGTDHETLIARSKDLFDGALPSANGVAARVLSRLGKLPEGETYRAKAEELLYAYRGMLHRAPQGTQTLILAAYETFDGQPVGPAAPDPIYLHTDITVLHLRPGASAKVEFLLEIAPGYHINTRKPAQSHLIPTAASFATDAPAIVGPMGYPSSEPYVVGEERLDVYQGRVVLTVPVTLTQDADPGLYHLMVTVHCQPCSDTECLHPIAVTHTLDIEVTTAEK
jgi:uncharacterized protein YyaL (SSP411 family)